MRVVLLLAGVSPAKNLVSDDHGCVGTIDDDGSIGDVLTARRRLAGLPTAAGVLVSDPG